LGRHLVCGGGDLISMLMGRLIAWYRTRGDEYGEKKELCDSSMCSWWTLDTGCAMSPAPTVRKATTHATSFNKGSIRVS
jgi:hypothetical protein